MEFRRVLFRSGRCCCADGGAPCCCLLCCFSGGLPCFSFCWSCCAYEGTIVPKSRSRAAVLVARTNCISNRPPLKSLSSMHADDQSALTNYVPPPRSEEHTSELQS